MTGGRADLALEHGVIFQSGALNLQREDALLVITDHLVSRVGGQVPDNAQTELIPRPLHLTHVTGYLQTNIVN